MGLTLSFTEPAAADAALAGGKGVNLARLTAAGFPVPAGFTVTTTCYSNFIRENGLEERLAQLASRIGYDLADSVETTTAEIRDLLMSTPLPAAAEAEIAAAYQALGAQPFVAVRSSGTAEDLAGASFAGQHDTYLDIRGAANVVDAVKRCWASLWTARATAYRQQRGYDHAEVGIAVVVQVMVASEVSGVMFTANPMSGAVDEYVINASWGLGEAIVAGLVTPDMVTLHRDTKATMQFRAGRKTLRIDRDPDLQQGTRETRLADGLAEAPCLTERQAAQLGALGERVTEYYEGYPQDIEWAYADGAFHLLQSRDITGVDFCWDEDLDAFQEIPKDPDQVWTRTYADAVWTGAITPLFYSYRAELGQYYRRDAGELWGVKNYASTRVYKYHKAFAYYSSRADYAISSQILAPGMRRDMYLENLPPSWREDIRKEPFTWMTVVKALARIGLTEKQTLPWNFFAEFYRQFNDKAEFEAALGPDDQGLAMLSDTALKRHALSRIENERRWVRFLWTTFHFIAPVASSLMTRIVEQWAPDVGVESSELLVGLRRPSATLVENQRLVELALMISSTPPLRVLFQAHPGIAFFEHLPQHEFAAPFAAEYARFVEEFPHRGHSDRDIYYPRRGDSPEMDYNALTTLLDVDPQDTERKTQAVVARREAATAKVVAKLRSLPMGDLKAQVFKMLQEWLLEFWVFRDDERHRNDVHNYAQRRAFREVGRRLVTRGVVAKIDDVFFFSHTELFAVLDRGKLGRLDTEKLAARRRNFERYRVEYTPPKYLIGDTYADLDNPDASDGSRLVGAGTSRGQITGRARIIRHLKDIALVQKGDILVTVSTDPGWTPVFSIISGLVLETGGLLAHGACISREYGIPAVQIDGAMTKIENGARITVDGDAGHVVLEDA